MIRTPDIRSILQEAMALHQQGQTARSEAMYREVLAIDPNEPNAWHLLGVAAWQRNDLSTAEDYVRKAIGFQAVAAYHSNLGGILRQKGDLPGSVEQYETALKLNPADAIARKELAQTLRNYGATLMADFRLEDAGNAYRRALEIEPENTAALNNLAMLLQNEGRRAEAQQLYSRALKIKPDNLSVLYNRSINLLTEEKFEEGWSDFTASEPHWRNMQDARPNLPWMSRPLWRGEDLDGKNILIWGDQGIGDEIVYISMLPDLVERGARITIECNDRLVPLVIRSFPDVTTLPRQKTPLPGNDFDYHAPGMWLARCLRPVRGAFPARKSFLKADPEKTAVFRKRYENFGKKRIVGLSWFTGSKPWSLARSIPLHEMLKPLRLQDMLIVDLQYGDQADLWKEARQTFPELTFIHDEDVDQLKNMDGFAAQIAACDCVVTIGNTTSHVAGALNLPGAVLLPKIGLTWYWFEKSGKCPWYPNLMLLRPEQSDRMAQAAAIAEGKVT